MLPQTTSWLISIVKILLIWKHRGEEGHVTCAPDIDTPLGPQQLYPVVLLG